MNERIPLLELLRYMDDDDGMISQAAKDYYYINYATDEQRKLIDKKEKIQSIKAAVSWILIAIGMSLLIFFRG